jgi:GTPase KRas protein
MPTPNIHSRYDPTIEDSYSLIRVIDGTTYHLHIFDTAGQEEYRTLFSRSTLSADAFLLVYDITSPSTLDSLSHFTNMIAMEAEERHYRTDTKGRSAPPPVKMVVGNKCDLDLLREVSAQEGSRWAKERRATFIETSAREFINVEETFAGTFTT